MKSKVLPVKQFAKEMRTIDKDSKVSQAYKMLKKGKNTHLIVTEESEPVGILSWKDLLWNTWEEAKEGEAANLYVSSIATRDLITIHEDVAVHTAARKMLAEDISSLPIKSNDKISNILTKRTILTNITEFPDRKVEAFMTTDVISASEGTSLTAAIQKMKSRDVSMLPILEEGILTGFVDVHGLARVMINIFFNPPYRHIDTALKRITLGDVMKGPFGLSPEGALYDFGREVVRKGVKGMPVVSSQPPRKLAGIVSETDVIRYIAELP